MSSKSEYELYLRTGEYSTEQIFQAESLEELGEFVAEKADLGVADERNP